MREYPWVARQENWTHVARYRLIAARVMLSRQWLEGLALPLGFLQRKGLTPTYEMAQASLRHLDSDTDVNRLEFPHPLLGAKTPDEFLEELSKAARIQQALVLDQILKKDSGAIQALRSITRKAGEKAAQAVLNQEHGDAIRSSSARRAFLALNQSSFFSLGSSSFGVLPERITDMQVSWVDLDCPHQESLVEIGPVADALCDLYVEWRAGFCAAWDRRMTLSRLPQEQSEGRCRYALTVDRGRD